MATVLKRYKSCTGGGVFVFDLSPYMNPFSVEAVDAAPAGFTEIINELTGNLQGYFVSGAANGDYSITIQGAPEGGSYTQFELEFEFSSACATEQEVCCSDDEVIIRWLGREGGIKEWNFTGVREFDVRVGDALTFKNSDFQLQYSQRKDIYSGKRISVSELTREQADFLDEIKYSIQAWEWDGETATPILVDNDSFFKYKSTQKFFEVGLQYVFSEELIMQTQ